MSHVSAASSRRTSAERRYVSRPRGSRRESDRDALYAAAEVRQRRRVLYDPNKNVRRAHSAYRRWPVASLVHRVYVQIYRHVIKTPLLTSIGSRHYSAISFITINYLTITRATEVVDPDVVRQLSSRIH